MFSFGVGVRNWFLTPQKKNLAISEASTFGEEVRLLTRVSRWCQDFCPDTIMASGTRSATVFVGFIAVRRKLLTAN
jgi:hypothetical protein